MKQELIFMTKIGNEIQIKVGDKNIEQKNKNVDIIVNVRLKPYKN